MPFISKGHKPYTHHCSTPYYGPYGDPLTEGDEWYCDECYLIWKYGLHKTFGKNSATNSIEIDTKEMWTMTGEWWNGDEETRVRWATRAAKAFYEYMRDINAIY